MEEVPVADTSAPWMGWPETESATVPRTMQGQPEEVDADCCAERTKEKKVLSSKAKMGRRSVEGMADNKIR